MYKETDNLIGIKFHPSNSKKDVYEVINYTTIKSLNNKNEYNGYTISEMLRYFNNKDWRIISSPNIIHEVW